MTVVHAVARVAHAGRNRTVKIGGSSASLRRACAAARAHRGMALPGALMLASMMLTTSAAWLEVTVAQAHHAASMHEHLRAAQAADGALTLCEKALRAGVAPVLQASYGARPEWTKPGVFDGPAAFSPAPSWPGSVRAPQCVIETAHVEGHPDARAYWITARGFGASESARAWLQLTIMHEAGQERRAWRRIVRVPA